MRLRCKEFSFWIIGKHYSEGIMLYPKNSSASPPHPDMPEEIKMDYNEAKDVVDISPRAASALLRLIIQKLCIDLGAKGENINEDIKYLVREGLPPRIQQALDTVRVTGNEAVHPGVMQPEDIAEVAHSLFDLVNLIVEYMITFPNKTKELFNNLPENKIKAIEKRDSKT